MELWTLDHSDEEPHVHVEERELRKLLLEVDHEELDVPCSLLLPCDLPIDACDVRVRDWLALLLLDVRDAIEAN